MLKRLTLPVLLAWVSLELVFMYMYGLRVSTSPMSGQLRADFCMTGEQYGLFGACYLYAYAMAQIPMGILLDKLGVRKVALISISLILVAVFFLASAQSLGVAYVSRSLLGLGSGAVMMSCLKFAADNMPPAIRGVFMGAGLSVGVAGALISGMIVPELLQVMSWRAILLSSLLIGIPVALSVIVFVPKMPQQKGLSWKKLAHDFSDVGAQIKKTISHWDIMLYGFISIGVYTPLATVADLWGTSFLSAKYGWDNALASRTIVMMYIGLIFGATLLPIVNGYVKNINVMLRGATLLITLTFCAVLYIPGLSFMWLVAGLVAIGALCGAEMMCFNGAAQFATPKTSGVIIGVVNTFNMLGGAMLNQAIGTTLDLNWSGVTNAGMRVYTGSDYTAALSVLAITSGICFAATFFLRAPSKHS